MTLLGKHPTDEARKKMSEAHLGKKFSEEHKKKIGKSAKGRIGFWAGKKHTDDYRRKMSKVMKRWNTTVDGKKATKSRLEKRWEGHTKEVRDHAREVREWRLKNKDRNSIIRKRYKARKKGAVGNHTLLEWLALKAFYGNMCLCCKRYEPEIKLTEDHIIPLSKGGSDYIENIQPLCGSCNSIKSNKTISYLFVNDESTERSVIEK